MILCKISELKEGMIIAQDVTVSGMPIPILKKGVILNKQYIDSLIKYGIGFLYVEPAEGYSGSKGEILSLTEIKNDIVFDGKVEINGNVPANTSIEVGESVIIKGNVADGCQIISRSGAIVIRGFVYGTGDNLLHLYAKQNISVGSANHAIIKTDGELSVDGDVIDTTIDVNGEVTINGRVIRSKINTNTRVIIGECGNKEGEPVIVTVSPKETQEIIQELLKIDTQISGLLKEKAQLQNVIDLIKKLGSAVEQLSEDKKIELAKSVKRFSNIASELAVLSDRKNGLMNNMKQILAIRRIIINSVIYPNVKIQIGGKSFITAKTEQRCAFNVEEGKIAIKTVL